MRGRWIAVPLSALVAACATGGAGDGTYDDSTDGGGAETGGVDSGRAGTETGPPPAQDSGASVSEAAPDDEASLGDGAAAQDSGSGDDVVTGPPDTGAVGQDASTGANYCPNTFQYQAEAATAIASGHVSLCLTGVCPAGQCCFKVVSPGNVCVAQ